MIPSGRVPREPPGAKGSTRMPSAARCREASRRGRSHILSEPTTGLTRQCRVAGKAYDVLDIEFLEHVEEHRVGEARVQTHENLQSRAERPAQQRHQVARARFA